MSMRSMRVGIDAAIPDGGAWGGVEQMLIGLVSGLGKLSDDGTHYVILTRPDRPTWLEPYLGPHQVLQPYPTPHGALASLAWRSLTRVGRTAYGQALQGKVRAWAGKARRSGYYVSEPGRSNGFLETLGLDVIHFPYQHFVRSEIPSVFNPHDLQHLHYPLFFTPQEVAQREAYYPVCCKDATCIAVSSTWVKDDIVGKYGVCPEKVQVIPLASPTQAYDSPDSAFVRQVRLEYQLPEQFAFYPAQTWPHKNHIRLLRALARLRDERGIRVELVCTGSRNAFWPSIAKEIESLGLQEQVRFLGFVPSRVLQAVYASALFVVIPTLFEAGSFPLFEAFQEGVAVACSKVTSLPEQAGDAALLFDPTSTEDIARVLEQLHSDAPLRARLRKQGLARAQKFSWERTGRTYRALYRKLAKMPLTTEESALLGTAVVPSGESHIEGVPPLGSVRDTESALAE
jgi:glycosyltransferase involved in cell wall biosynthesis